MPKSNAKSAGKTHTTTAKNTEPQNEMAPSGEITSHSECQAQVMSEIIQSGKGTAKELSARLAKKWKVNFTEAEVQEAIDNWVERGWCAITDGKTHISAAAMAYLR